MSLAAKSATWSPGRAACRRRIRLPTQVSSHVDIRALPALLATGYPASPSREGGDIQRLGKALPSYPTESSNHALDPDAGTLSNPPFPRTFMPSMLTLGLCDVAGGLSECVGGFLTIVADPTPNNRC